MEIRNSTKINKLNNINIYLFEQPHALQVSSTSPL